MASFNEQKEYTILLIWSKNYLWQLRMEREAAWYYRNVSCALQVFSGLCGHIKCPYKVHSSHYYCHNMLMW